MRWNTERKELFMKVLKDLVIEWMHGAYVVVEGRRDLEALKKLGLKSRVMAFKLLNCCMADAVEKLCQINRVVILTDFDHEGDKLASYIGETLVKRGVKVDLNIRRRLSSILRGEIKGIEDIAPLLKRLESRFDNLLNLDSLLSTVSLHFKGTVSEKS